MKPTSPVHFHAGGLLPPRERLPVPAPHPRRLHDEVAGAWDRCLVWDQVPTNGKLQILGFVAFLEFFGELGGRVGAPAHYMRGGLPGAYPSFKKYLNGVFPHPVPLDLYDPFGIFSNASPEKKARGRLIEINNGRLAMIGLFLCGNENFTARSPPRWRGDVGSSPLDGTSATASSPQKDLVKSCTRLTG